MAAKRIGLSLSGDAIPIEVFIAAARSLKDLLSEIDISISGSRNLEWTISDLTFSSANFAISPLPLTENSSDFGTEIISSALAGIELIEKQAEWPENFTDEALLKAKEIVCLINGRVEKISVFGNSGQGPTRRLSVTQHTAANVDQLIGTSTHALGSVEGTLETLSIHGGTSFNIYDVITLRRIRCLCDRKTLNELSSDRLGQRLLVEGEVKYNFQGFPTSIKVSTYRIFDPTKKLPQPKDIRGLFSKSKVDIDELGEYLRQ
ncbi:MAG: hypothetical protein AB7P69_26125 [Candidatus Binatia bacterium]